MVLEMIYIAPKEKIEARELDRQFYDFCEEQNSINSGKEYTRLKIVENKYESRRISRIIELVINTTKSF